jgi:hypothetical protein
MLPLPEGEGQGEGRLTISHSHRDWIHIAWAGWQMRAPSDWRPLDIRGDSKQGVMILGDAQHPCLQVHWWRRTKKQLDATRWVRKRFRLSGSAVESARGGPTPQDFQCLAWIEGSGTGKRKARSAWCGYDARAGLLLELVTGGNVSAKTAKRISRRVIPSLKASPADHPTRWAVFNSSFEIPAEFLLRERRLALGDIALGFSARRGRRLVVRQVYPSELALKRREMPKWLDASPFKEKRRFRAAGSAEAWSTESGGRTLKGYRRGGWKRLPFPLGWCAARWCASTVVQDRELDRLLLAEYDAPSETGDGPLSQAIAGMNWAHFHRGGGS